MTELTHYLEIKAIPQAELTQTMVINHLMQSLHGILPAYNGKMAIGFPAYGQLNTLGGIIRLFGSQADITKLHNQLLPDSQFTDYALITTVTAVPETITGYIRFSRVRAKGKSALKRAKKRLKAQGIWTEDILQRMITKWGAEKLKQPHIHLTSKSTKQAFILWIKRQTFDNPIQGDFNAYGLSQQATIPNF